MSKIGAQTLAAPFLALTVSGPHKKIKSEGVEIIRQAGNFDTLQFSSSNKSINSQAADINTKQMFKKES